MSMGYYTSYNMDVNNVKSQAEHEAILDKLHELNVIGYALDVGYWSERSKSSSFYSYDEAKWYDHDADMLEISKQFPEMTFKLTGVGEDDDDRWYTLYRNGEFETIQAVVTWPEPEKIEWKE